MHGLKEVAVTFVICVTLMMTVFRVQTCFTFIGISSIISSVVN